MLVLDALKVAALFTTLGTLQAAIRLAATHQRRGPLSSEISSLISEMNAQIKSVCETLKLPISEKISRNLYGCTTLGTLDAALEQSRNVLLAELDGRKFFGPLTDYAQYYEHPELFGREVFNAFGSANQDITEAGTCLALERSTACVLHLMRALEVGLAALATTVGITRQNDWGRYLREIETELDKRAKAAGARSLDEQFYAEAAANFDRLRRAYRNPTMHPEKSYSQERALEILLAAKAFMSHLATKIRE